jgi:beta-lactamase regulating signal transducer with metallopeptidase domain/Tol biopolymer transport system component
MTRIINDCLTGFNRVGEVFCTYAGGAFVQSALLVLLLFAIDLLLRKRVRAVVRYCVWLLVLVKLVLPPTLALPTGIGYWLRARVPATSPVPGRPAETIGFETPRQHRPEPLPPSNERAPSLPPAQAAEPVGPVTPAASSLTPVTWQAIVLLFWLAGVLAFAILLMQRLRFVRGLVAASTVAGGDLPDLLEQCRRQIGVRRQVGLKTLDTLPSPAVCGLLKPVILMPTSLVERLAPEGLKAALIHELAHIRRVDLWINAVQTFLQVVYFYNPFVWFANAMIRRTCEEAVDETVLVALGGQARNYSNTLIDIGEMAFWKADFGLRLIGVAESRKALKGRIKQMLTRPVPKNARIGALGMFTILVVAAVLLPMARAEKSNKDAPVTAPVTAAQATEKVPPASESDTVIDPKTGVEFSVAKKITGENDIIKYDRLSLSPNGKFLLWRGRVVPLDASPAFMLKELKGADIASWSPDGQKIAFNSEGIAVLPVSPETGRPTGPVRKLLEDNGDWFRGKIYWSADSKRILFVKWNSRMEREVGSINLRDGRLDKQPDYADFGLLSPDGKTIAYSMPEDGVWARPVSGGDPWIARVCSTRLFDDPAVWTSDSQWVVSAVGAYWREEIHFARVSDGQNFDVFPPQSVGTFVGKSVDGKKLYFYRSSFDWRMTSRVVPVSGGPALDADPFPGLDLVTLDHIWSSDSGSVAVLGMDKEGHGQLWSIPLRGGDRVRFKVESLGKDGPALLLLSPDGSKALYSVGRGTNQETKGSDLYVVPISLKEGRATGPATLVFEGWQFPSPSLPEIRLAWSPDGTKIAVPHKSDQGNGHWVLFADGSKPIQITRTPDEAESYPQWSPDGKMIAFYRCAPDREMLQVIPAAGGTAKTILTTPKGQFSSFGWSSDSKEIAVACDGTISGFPITGSNARVIVRLQDAGYEGVSWLGWSPDGQYLAFYAEKKGEASRLCLFAPDTGKITTLENSPESAWSFAWSPDSKMICCTAVEAEKTRPAGVIRELDVAEAAQKAPPVAETKPAEAAAAPQAEPIVGPVFTDNFDDGASKHWRFHDFPDEGPPPGHAVENGQLMLSGNARACLDGIDWTDYIVTVRVCMKESVASGSGVFGIVARATPSQFGSGRKDRYNLVIACNNNAPGELALTLQYADASDTLRTVGLRSSPYSLVRDTWYTLEFEVRGQQLRGYLDGKLVIEATDARLSKGGVWLNTWRARALFDDFSVRQLP